MLAAPPLPPGMKRLLLLFLALALLVIGPFLLWGGRVEALLSPQSLAANFHDSRDWAWLAGLGLLLADLVLPIPGTAVMSALGLVYGWLLGGFVGLLGSTGSGLLAYLLCRGLGRRAALWLAGEDGLAEGERLFQGEPGPWIVALSRWLPVLPETVACLAGMAHMPLRRFLPALLAGSAPQAFAFATIGHRGESQPQLALLLSALLPPLLWIAIRKILRRWETPPPPPKA